jgi:hypothetical protein
LNPPAAGPLDRLPYRKSRDRCPILHRRFEHGLDQLFGEKGADSVVNHDVARVRREGAKALADGRLPSLPPRDHRANLIEREAAHEVAGNGERVYRDHEDHSFDPG